MDGINPETKRGVRRWVVRELSGAVLAAVVLVLVSGRWGWVMAWALAGVYLASTLSQALAVSPELLAERAGRMRKGTKSWDRFVMTFMGVASLVKLVVAALDARFGWPGEVHPAVQIGALAAALLGNALVTWSMAANSFFAFSVRIQDERGQRVCTGGPYRYVRHPGYAGAVLFEVAAALMLGSLWALIPAGAAAGAFIVRTMLEDRLLRRELSGYDAYARATRYRLAPGIW